MSGRIRKSVQSFRRNDLGIGGKVPPKAAAEASRFEVNFPSPLYVPSITANKPSIAEGSIVIQAWLV